MTTWCVFIVVLHGLRETISVRIVLSCAYQKQNNWMISFGIWPEQFTFIDRDSKWILVEQSAIDIFFFGTRVDEGFE